MYTKTGVFVLTSLTAQAFGVRGEEQEEGGEGDGRLPGAAKGSSKELKKQQLTALKEDSKLPYLVP